MQQAQPQPHYASQTSQQPLHRNQPQYQQQAMQPVTQYETQMPPQNSQRQLTMKERLYEKVLEG